LELPISDKKCMKINIFWFRRDLRFYDNTGLNSAFDAGLPVLPLFIFDEEIINELPADDARITFIYERLSGLDDELHKYGSSLLVMKGKPENVFIKLMESYDINSVYINKDYEPYAVSRDSSVCALVNKKQISLLSFKDQVIFEGNEVVKPDNKPYTIFTPYKQKWLSEFRKLSPAGNKNRDLRSGNFYKFSSRFPSLEEIGFRRSNMKVRQFDSSVITDYEKYRDLPAEDRTSYLSPHLRFGTVSIRSIVSRAMELNQVFLSELIWREYFMQILFHFPAVVTGNFRSVYDDIRWMNDEKSFERWCIGETGYTIVDAGMRQLNETGYMHNRVRMITAGFLCKHLLTDWRWGEAYFAQKLLDYELSSNNGNWQWAAGTGCDAAPYFRIFNPEIQQKKFDPANEYVKRWIDNFEKPGYPEKIVDHIFARQRAIEVYKTGIRKKLYK
jgi:deoxyribodipyrimidine photo-lyase